MHSSCLTFERDVDFLVERRRILSVVMGKAKFCHDGNSTKEARVK